MPRLLPAIVEANLRKVMSNIPLCAAQVTLATCQWLMGRCTINEVELADGTTLASGVSSYRRLPTSEPGDSMSYDLCYSHK